MASNFHILEVTCSDAETVAVLPLSQVADRETSQKVRADFLLLAEFATTPIVVDLRAVEGVAGSFITQLVELHKVLSASALPYTLLVSPGLREILDITHLDRLLPVVDGPGIVSCERAKLGSKAAQLKPQSSAPTISTSRRIGHFLRRWFAFR